MSVLKVNDLQQRAGPERNPLWVGWRGRKSVTADFILNYFEVRRSPVPVPEIAKRMGIVLKPISSGEASGAVRIEGRTATIFWNPAEAEVRQRFTLAHEIGHLLLHPSDLEFRDLQFTNFNQKEIEANQFAADLLMPAWMLWKVASAVGRDVRALSAAFDVSQVAMSYRMKNLRML